MTRILRVLKSFIEDGSVSVTSHADDNIDYLYSTLGLSQTSEIYKASQVTVLKLSHSLGVLSRHEYIQ